MYIHLKTLRVLLQYLNFKSEREFNSKLQIISRLRQKVSVAGKSTIWLLGTSIRELIEK